MDIHALQQENLQLKKMLNTAISEAKLNKVVLQRFIDTELQMLSCTKLTDLMSLLIKDFRQNFKLNIVTLILHNKDELVSPLLDNLSPELAKNLTLIDDPHLLSTIYPDTTFRAGEINQDFKKQLFPHNPFVLSCVLLPLINKGQLVGSLHLGAKDPNRYHSEYRYDYLERMSALLAACIDNCIIQENLAYLSSTDTLTKLYNRHSFDLEIDKALQRAGRQKQYLSLLFLDIDHFKHVNDTYGHSAGDAILKTFASILKKQLRNTDFLARFGGEEFAILLPDCKPEQAQHIANTLRVKITEQTFDTLNGAQINISTSIGVSRYFFDKNNTLSLVELARVLLNSSDEALYKAKQSGRNKVVFKEMPPASRKINSL